MADSRHDADQKERQEHTQEKNSPSRPFWLPADPDHPLLADAEEVLADLYQELVVEAADAQRRTTGMTIVQLTWLELATAHELGAVEDDLFNSTPNRELLERYLKITKAKARANEFLLKLDRFQTAPPAKRSSGPLADFAPRKNTGPEQGTPETDDRRSPMADPFDRFQTGPQPSRKKTGVEQRTPETDDRRSPVAEPFDRPVAGASSRRFEPELPLFVDQDPPLPEEFLHRVEQIRDEAIEKVLHAAGPYRETPDPPDEPREKGGEKNHDTTRERRRRKKLKRQRRKACRKSNR